MITLILTLHIILAFGIICAVLLQKSEGGGLGIREIANYDSQKWDVSKDKIYQDPLPTQSNNKFS